MKKIFVFLFILANANTVFAQEYLDKVAKKACDCIEKNPPGAKPDLVKMQAGVCLIQAFTNEDRERLKSETGLSFDQNGEKIGETLGMHMATQCPATLVKMSTVANDSTGSVAGVVTLVENEPFVVFSVKDRNGRTDKYIWLHPLVSTIDLPSNYRSLVGKNVELKFENKDIFDPKIGEYRRFRILTGIK